MKVAYGYDVTGEDDPYVRLVREAIALGNEAFKPGRWLVDAFPIRKSSAHRFPVRADA